MAPACSEGQIVVAVEASVDGRAPVPLEDGSHLGHGVEQGLCDGGEGIAVVTDLAVFVSQQVRVLGQGGEGGDVQGVVEQFEGRELRGLDQIVEGERGAGRSHAMPPDRRAPHRFFPGGRLPVGAGVWNTSK